MIGVLRSIHELVQVSKMPYFRTVKASAAAGLFLFVSCVLGAQVPAETAPRSIDDPRSLAAWFATLGFRQEGSEAEAQVFTALKGWFAGRTMVNESDFSDMGEQYSFSKRLWLHVGGRLPGELVVVAPTDGENHRGLAWAVAWAKRALTRGTEISLTFLFTGAERGSGELAGMGSRAFLQDFSPVDPAAVLYLDSGNSSDDVMLTTESGRFLSPLWMVQGLTEAFQKQGLTPRIVGASPSLFRLDLPDRRNALEPWFEQSIPALGIASGPAGSLVVAGLEQFVASMPKGLPRQGDQHYLAFHFDDWRVFWDQESYVSLFLGLVAVLVFGYALVGRPRRGSLRSLGKGFWQLPVLFSALFLALLAGTGLAAVLQQARGDPEFWRRVPWAVMAFKGEVASGLTLLLILPFRRSPLSTDPDFYGQSALVWFGIMTVAAAAVELSFSFYFLWALIWAAILVAAPWKWLKFVCLLGGPLWLFWAAYEVFGPHPDLELSRWAIDSPVAGNFILTVLIFPFLLQVNAWHLSGRRHQERNEGLRAMAQLTLWGLGALSLGLLLLRIGPSTPVPPNQPPQRIDLTGTTRGTSTPGLWGNQD